MKLSLDTIQIKLRPAIKLFKQYAAFIFVLVFLGAYVFLVQRVGHLIQEDPSQAAIDSKLKPVNRLKVDEQAVKKITELETQNIEVKSLFDQARQNPFTE